MKVGHHFGRNPDGRMPQNKLPSTPPSAQRRTRTFVTSVLLVQGNSPWSMLCLQFFGLYALRVRIAFVEYHQLTTRFGVLTIRPRFISEAERVPNSHSASNVAVFRPQGR